MCAWSECGGIGRRCRPLPVARRLPPAAASVESQRAAPHRSALHALPATRARVKSFNTLHETCTPWLRYRTYERPFILAFFCKRLAEKFVFFILFGKSVIFAISLKILKNLIFLVKLNCFKLFSYVRLYILKLIWTILIVFISKCKPQQILNFKVAKIMYWNIDGMYGRWQRVVSWWQAGLAGGQLDAAAGRGSAGARHGRGLLRAALRHRLLHRSHHGQGSPGAEGEAKAQGPQGRHTHAIR